MTFSKKEMEVAVQFIKTGISNSKYFDQRNVKIAKGIVKKFEEILDPVST